MAMTGEAGNGGVNGYSGVLRVAKLAQAPTVLRQRLLPPAAQLRARSQLDKYSHFCFKCSRSVNTLYYS
jgi:hypothetical protein